MSKVCIIGAGLSGLTSIKACLEEGLHPLCYETCKDVGGLWNTAESMLRKEGATIYPSLLTNHCKAMTSFSDFPVPIDFPMYLSSQYFHEYLKMYAIKFCLSKHIKFQHKVIQVEEHSLNDANQCSWRVRVKSKVTDEETVEEFDKVIIAVGEYTQNYIPSYPGSESFQGKIQHSSAFVSKKDFIGQNILIVGAGNSGCDLAVEIGRSAKKLYLSSRSGSYINSRTRNGWPFEMLHYTRFKTIVRGFLPDFISNYLTAWTFKKGFDHKAYGLECKYKIQNPCATWAINDGLPLSISSGNVEVVPDIERIHGKTVHLTNGKVLQDIDAIYFATGFKPKFPFICNKHLPNEFEEMKMYKFIFPLLVSKPGSLAVIGCAPFVGESRTVTSEMQARYAACVFAGVHKLPPIHDMTMECIRWYNSLCKYGRFVYKLPPQTYTPELAKEIGVYPNFFKIFVRDPKLALALFFGPTVGSVYRIVGRNNYEKYYLKYLVNINSWNEMSTITIIWEW